MARKDLLTRLADAGEEAIGRLGDAPGADRVLGVANSMRDRMDELQRRVRGIDELERRVAELERRLEQAEAGSGTPATRKAAGTRKPSTRKRPAGSAAAKKTAAKTPAGGSGRGAAGKPRSGSRAEPTGPATQGASEVGNPSD